MKRTLILFLFLHFPLLVLAQKQGILQAELDSLIQKEAQLEYQLELLRLKKSEIKALLNSGSGSSISEASVVLETNMDASLRAEPRSAARVLQIIKKESPVVAIDYEGAFWKVRHEGVEGWVMRPFVDEGEDAVQMRLAIQKNGRLTNDINPMHNYGVHPEDRRGKDLLITSFGIHPPNSAGGVGIYYTFEHLDSTRTIRDISFTFTPYNINGEKERGQNSGASTKRVRRYGPISVFDGINEYETENFWYNNAIRCVEIDQVYVRYNDGTHRRWKEINKLLPVNLNNNCRSDATTRME